MKTLLTVILTLTIAWAFSQDEKSKKEKNEKEYNPITFASMAKSHGGFGSISAGYSQIQNIDAAMFGFQGGWMMGHNMGFGIFGNCFASDFNYKNDKYISGGYAGLFVEPIIGPRFPVHLSIPIRFGMGGATNFEKYSNYDNFDSEVNYTNSDMFFVIEPGVEIELNMTKYFRIAFGAYYRQTTDLMINGFDNDALTGLSGGVTLKFGKF